MPVQKTIVRLLALLAVVILSVLMATGGAGAAQDLPPGCTKDRGTITCTTTEGPGKNQGGVGNETTDETQGNLKNKNPEPQELADEECEQNPENSRGGPIACP